MLRRIILPNIVPHFFTIAKRKIKNFSVFFSAHRAGALKTRKTAQRAPKTAPSARSAKELSSRKYTAAPSSSAGKKYSRNSPRPGSSVSRTSASAHASTNSASSAACARECRRSTRSAS